MPEYKKNSLTIGLTESAVFLRTNDITGRNRNSDSTPSLLRGVLTLELVKPTKISSIQLELQAKVLTSWPEGIGARRIEISEEHKVFTATNILFRASPARRPVSIGPGTHYGLVDDIDDELSRPATPTGRDPVRTPPPPPEESSNSIRSRLARAARRVSADASIFQRNSLAYHVHDPPIPPYSPSPILTPAHTPTHSGIQLGDTPAQHLEEVRNALRADLSDARNATGSSSASGSQQEHTPSRRPSTEDVPENEPGPSLIGASPAPSPLIPDASRSPSESRGRDHRKRFSLSSVSSALVDAIRSSSPKSARNSFFSSRPKGPEVQEVARGRSTSPGIKSTPSTPVPHVNGHKKEKRLSLNNILKLESSDQRPEGDGWKEFKKGTYTYPISFAIPGHAPPSLDCQYGSVTWRVKARVHRPGAFSTKLAASREIVVVSSPTEEDTEGSDNIIVERLWDQQMQYLVSISGRSFYIGGTVPVSFTMMPFAKIKIYRLAVFLEERIDYHTQFKRIARTEPVNRIVLLSLKDESKEGGSILPLESNDVDAFKHSPLYALVNPEDDVSEIASSLMGPGPWTFHQELQLPSSCKLLHFTNKNKRSNITIAHNLKLVIRVQRGDDEAIDEKTGKRKLFDIVIQTPVHVLSCRCNPDWTSLPHYSQTLQDPESYKPQCPCVVKYLSERTNTPSPQRQSMLTRMGSSRSQTSESSASAAETNAINPAIMPSLQTMDSALQQSTQYERLVSGQVSEAGEAPPAYRGDGI